MEELSAGNTIHLTKIRGAEGAPLNCPNTYHSAFVAAGWGLSVLTTFQEMKLIAKAEEF